MNLYNYWLKLKTLYPISVADCVNCFRQAHPLDWKSHFKSPDEIVAWLEPRRIQVITRKKQEGQIRFELKAYEETTVTAFHFASRETALYDAIERAFRILEQRALRSRANDVHYQRQRKAKPTQANNPSWHEQVKKLQ